MIPTQKQKQNTVLHVCICHIFKKIAEDLCPKQTFLLWGEREREGFKM